MLCTNTYFRFLLPSVNFQARRDRSVSQAYLQTFSFSQPGAIAVVDSLLALRTSGPLYVQVCGCDKLRILYTNKSMKMKREASFSLMVKDPVQLGFGPQ